MNNNISNNFNAKKLISVKEFSSEYGFRINKAYEIVNSPDFPKLKVGRKIYIIRSQIDDWINYKANILINNNLEFRKEDEHEFNYRK